MSPRVRLFVLLGALKLVALLSILLPLCGCEVDRPLEFEPVPASSPLDGGTLDAGDASPPRRFGDCSLMPSGLVCSDAGQNAGDRP